ncbi:MAG TPA: hypothetical protein ACFYEK_10470 [Candidatus Wunengus sp. YC60]|jgi:hypothetical protein|uniref:hypothetical protein n=1 Tax=Candidatus Wunengus sp. YC60 TaxID=3367697 RepID=UPI00402A5A93
MKYRGGFSGGNITTSGMFEGASLQRKHRNDSFIACTRLSNIYLAVKVMGVSGSFPYLQFTLLIKVLKPFRFSIAVWNVS